jgi:hypothetical protein
VFFPERRRADKVYDGTGEAATLLPDWVGWSNTTRLIYTRRGPFRRKATGVVVPTEELRPLVKGLIKRVTDPSEVHGTIEKLREYTNLLIPEHSLLPPKKSYRDMARHGSLYSPLIALRNRVGGYAEWAAVFIAMARNAGLEARVMGVPPGLLGGGKYTVWPVVRHPLSEKWVPVDPSRRIRGFGERRTRREHRIVGLMMRKVDPSVDKRFLYEEYEPKEPIEIPKGLRVRAERLR